MSLPAERLQKRIESEGPLPFAEFMEEALYGEGGYYATETLRIGPEGDFVTGASISPLFGASTARLVAKLGERLGGDAELLEIGYGDASHLAAVVAALPAGHRGRLLGWDRVARPLPPAVAGLPTLEAVAASRIRGLVFSYELFDALPFHRFRRAGEEWEELRVKARAGAFDWQQVPFSLPELADLVQRYAGLVEDGQIVDLAPAWTSLYGRLAAALEVGLLVTCDYGFERRRLLDARIRRHGTLACYRRQTVHRNPFVEVGSQDITAHVDFTALIEEGEKAGLETVGLVSQAEWLGACGLFRGLAEAEPQTRLEAVRLLDPAAMGTDIRVLVQGRNIDADGLFDLSLRGRESSQ